MATKKRARITLVGPLSYSVGRYRFQKGKPLVTEDQELIGYLHGDPNFQVELLAVEAEAKAKVSPPVESKPAAKPESKPEAKSKAVVDDEVEEVKAPVKAAPPSKLARKNEKQKKETAHETD